MNEYSSEKATFHLDRMQVLRDGGQPDPVHVLLVISDLCSHDCAFCCFRMPGNANNQLFGVEAIHGRNNNPNRMIPYLKVVEILDDCREMGVKAIELTGGGEPSVHPQFKEILNAAIDRGFEVGLITHGALLSPAAIQTLTRARWVRFSVDAATSSTYSAIRRVHPVQFDRVKRNMAAIVREKHAVRSDLTIGVSFVLTLENFQEVLQAAEDARELGVDIFRISAEFGPERLSTFAAVADEITAMCTEASQLSTPNFRVINQWPDRKADLALGHPEYRTCWYQQFTTFIGGDQNVYRCCNTAYNARGLIGSIKEQSFQSLWRSAEKQRQFAAFDARGCAMCHVNDRNRAIDRSLQVPAHVNFV
jgi:MoaA/NifB/PqqE/SkfB family radical SAM enzyme